MGTIRNKLGLIIAALFVMLVILFVFQEIKTAKILQLKKQEIRRVFELGMEHINRQTGIMEKSALDLAAAGELLFRIRNTLPRRQMDELLKQHVVRHVRNYPEALGGGIWYEPNRFFRDRRYTGPYAYRENGKVVFTLAFATPGYNYPQHHWYTVAIPPEWNRSRIRPKKTYWSRPYADTVGSETNMITVNALLYDEQKTILGTATTDWGLAGLVRFLERLQITPGSRAILHHRQSGVIFYNSLDPGSRLKPVTRLPWFPAKKLQQPGIISDLPVEFNNREYRLYSGLSDAGLRYSVVIPGDEMMPEIHFINRITRWLAFLSFAGVTLFMVLLSRQIHVSLKQLTRRIESFGDGNFNIDFAVEGNDEIAKISLAFKEMSSRLRQNIKELQSVNREKQELEERYLQSQKMEAVGRLAGGVAHDFNNILQVIFGYGELLQQSLYQDNEKQRLLEIILETAGKAARLTRQLLAFSRKQILEKKHHNLNGIISELKPMLDRLIGENIILRDDLQADLPDCNIDKGQIEQVLLNLAVNARDAMPLGGTLTFATAEAELEAPPESDQPPGRYARLTVSDTGSGIPGHLLPHIFEPFFTTKESGKGTGLGLTTVFGIIKQHGGWIDIDTRPGQGTAFKIFLPAVAPADRESRPEDKPAVRITGNGEHILVIEDDSTAKELLVHYLEQHGYRVSAAGDVAGGLHKLRTMKDTLHLLLSDIMLPDGSCFDILPFRRPGLPVILMSGYIDKQLYEKVLHEKSFSFLQKPFEMGRLLLAIRHKLDEAPPLDFTPGP